MIHAVIYERQEKTCAGFYLKGHAGYAKKGQDIVCAAVSALVINTVNAIEAFTRDDMSVSSSEEDGAVECHFDRQPSHEADLLLRTMILGLKNIAEEDDYKEYIDLTFEEV